MKFVTRTVFLTGFALQLVCCGGGQNQSTKDKLLESVDEDVSVLEDITGIDDETEVAMPSEERAPAEIQAEKAAGQPALEGEPIDGPNGALVATLIITGQAVEGLCSVETATDRPEVVTQDIAAGTEMPLAAGKYDVHCKVTALAGAPVVSLRNVDIPGGRRIKKEIKVLAGEITLVTGAGKGCRKQKIRIKENGGSEWFEGDYKTCVPIRLQAGEYEAEMGGGKFPTPVTGIQVYDGSKRNMRVTAQ